MNPRDHLDPCSLKHLAAELDPARLTNRFEHLMHIHVRSHAACAWLRPNQGEANANLQLRQRIPIWVQTAVHNGVRPFRKAAISANRIVRQDHLRDDVLASA